jgi:two-component system NtrC family response regulator
MIDPHPGEIIGTSEAASRIRSFVEEAGRSSDPVTLAGEPGTGKQLTATLIHECSSRSRAPFLVLDCSLYYERELRRELFGYSPDGGSPKSHKGLFEFATQGTCYLSRIEEMSPAIQHSILRFLETGKFTRLGDGKEVTSGVRLIVSSDKNLSGFVGAGLFDPSLHEVLGRLFVRCPPLRDRREDIPALVQYFLGLFAAEEHRAEASTLSPDALQALEAYPWPHNLDEVVRESCRLVKSGIASVRSENLSMEIANFWFGQRSDPGIRKVIEQIDACIREFKVLCSIESHLGQIVAGSCGLRQTRREMA